ncbi:MAG: site-specific DNA-methyltransferase [Chitinophagaceae bacterium]
MDGTSLNITDQKLNALRELLPEVFSEGKIDWEKLKATLGENINFTNERYVLNWAGKSEAFKVLQTPSTKTLVPCPEESLKKDGTNYAKGETFYVDNRGNHENQINHSSDNIFIEGENLEVLKVLQKSYFGKVKMIYIDPPYNTGNDSFIYPDKFSETKAEYEKRVGDKDEDGYMTKDGMFKKNSKENGQYHSNWLNMMMPRLYLAKNLLRQDGVIFVSIDDNEVHNLRLLMNEIFGEENFVGLFPWKKRTAKSDVPFGVSQDYEWILSFTKASYGAGIDIERKYYQTEDFPNDRWRLSDITTQRSEEERPNCAFEMIDPKTEKKYSHNPKRVWGVSRDTFQSYYDKGKIVFPDDYDFLKISIPAYRVFESEDKAKALKKYGSEKAKKAVSTFLPKEVGMSEDGNKEIVELFNQKIFSFPKPINLIKHFLKTINETDYTILDFFAGSGSTAHAVMELNKEDGGNRKYICVQLPELTEEKSEAYKAGYKTIADLSKERIRRASKKNAEDIKEEIRTAEAKIKELKSELQTEETKAEIENLQSKVEQLKTQDLGFKVLKLSDSNFKQWQQIGGKDAKALQEQMQLFIDPVSENATIENMVYELLLKSGKDLNSNIVKQNDFYAVNNNELVLLLEKATQEIIDTVIASKPKKVIALDKLFAGNDQLKTNTVLQMRDASVEFKTI